MADSQLQALEKELCNFKRHAFAETTKATYKVHLRAYLRFCIYFKLAPVPCKRLTILLYTVYLSRTLRPDSIRQYLNIIRIVHLEAGFPNPLEDFYGLSQVLRGIKRLKGTPSVQKAPMTPAILCEMNSHIDTSIPFWATFWAACLTAFFCFCRKSTLLCKTGNKVDPRNTMCRKYISLSEQGHALHIRHTNSSIS